MAKSKQIWLSIDDLSAILSANDYQVWIFFIQFGGDRPIWVFNVIKSNFFKTKSLDLFPGHKKCQLWIFIKDLIYLILKTFNWLN